MGAEERPQRKSPQDAIYFDDPLPWSPPGEESKDLGAKEVDNQLLRKAILNTPSDEQWYGIMLSFSRGHATASASRINQGLYGDRVQAAYRPLPNNSYPDSHMLYIRKGLGV
jgi:hypothetical protein